MHPLHLARRVVRHIVRRIRLPLTRRRAAVASAFAVVMLAGLAVNAHAGTHNTAGGHVPTWLFSKMFRAIGQLMIALGDWLATLGR